MLDSTVAAGVATVLTGILLVIGAAGVILPVLPGSLLILIVLPIWGVLLGTTPAWIAVGMGMVCALIGWSASTVLTSRALIRERIPRGPIIIALVAGIVGLFLLPPLGLFIGFAGGLFGAEYFRRNQDLKAAAQSSLAALKAMGIGIVVEFLLAGTAISCFFVGALVHFLA